MFHCVIPCSSNLQRPIRIYHPDRSLHGRYRFTRGNPRVTVSDPNCLTSQKNSSTKHSVRSAAIARFSRFTKALQSGSRSKYAKKDKVVREKAVPAGEETTNTSTVKSECADAQDAKNSATCRPVSLFRRFCWTFPSISPSRVRRIVQLCQQTVFIKEFLSGTARRHTSHDKGNSDTNQSLLGAVTKKFPRTVFRMLLSLEFHRGWQLRNPPDSVEDEIFKYNCNWKNKVASALRCSIQRINGVRQRARTVDEMQKIWIDWKHFGSNGDELQAVLDGLVPLYTLRDLTKRFTELPNCLPRSDTDATKFWIQFDIRIPGIRDLREIYAELSPFYDNYVPDYFEEDYTMRMKEKERKLNSALKRRDFLKVRQLCRLGCCSANRDAAWTLLLRDKSIENAAYTKLLTNYIETEINTDRLMTKSVLETVGNSDQFFNFVQLVHQVMQLFLRDTGVFSREKSENRKHAEMGDGSYWNGLDGSTQNGECDSDSPERDLSPNVILPFHEVAFYAAPLAYVFLKPRPFYFAFKELFSRYFRYLTEISTHPQGILSLYCLFERVFHEKEYQLWYHLRVTMKIQLADFVVPWLTMAYVGFIEVDQVLLLWDRIVGYNDLRLLALLAFGIFSIRKNPLMKSKNEKEIETALCDILTIEVVPLLQMVLFM